MNLLRTFSLVVALALLLSTLAAISTLMNLADFSEPHLTQRIIQTGRVHHLYLASETWRNFPGDIGSIGVYVDFTALSVTGVFMGAILVFGRRLRMPWTVLGWAVALSAAAPYATGLYVLHDNVTPERAGPWMATMLMSVLYAALALLLLSAFDMVRSRPEAPPCNMSSERQSVPSSPVA